MTTPGSREKCVRIWSEKRQFRVSYVNARPNWPVAAGWKALLTQTALELRVCKPPGVGATVNQN